MQQMNQILWLNIVHKAQKETEHIRCEENPGSQTSTYRNPIESPPALYLGIKFQGPQEVFYFWDVLYLGGLKFGWAGCCHWVINGLSMGVGYTPQSLCGKKFSVKCVRPMMCSPRAALNHNGEQQRNNHVHGRLRIDLVNDAGPVVGSAFLFAELGTKFWPKQISLAPSRRENRGRKIRGNGISCREFEVLIFFWRWVLFYQKPESLHWMWGTNIIYLLNNQIISKHRCPLNKISSYSKQDPKRVTYSLLRFSHYFRMFQAFDLIDFNLIDWFDPMGSQP